MTCQGDVQAGGGTRTARQVFGVYGQLGLGLSNMALLGILARKWVWTPNFETSVVSSGVCSYILAKTTSSLFPSLGYVLQWNPYLLCSGPNMKTLAPVLVNSFRSSVFLIVVFFSSSPFLYLSFYFHLLGTCHQPNRQFQ